MTGIFKKLILAGLLAVSAIVTTPMVSQADDYWDGYWTWYDGSYRPYYYRRQYYSPNTYSGGYYGRPYYGDGYNGGYYSRGYRSNYYGTPNIGYREYRGGGSVNVGGLRFGWR